MRTSILLAAWSLALLLLPAERTAAQDGLPTDKPYIFFSASPEENTDAAPKAPLRQLNLRPNQDQTYFVYVHNPTKDKAAVKVQLVSSPRKGLALVAAEKDVEVGAKKTERVALAANKAQLPPSLPPVPGPDGKIAPTPPAAIPLYSNMHVRAVFADGTEDEKGAKIDLIGVTGYVDVQPTPGKDELKIVVKNKQTDLVGGSIPVKLTPRYKNGEPIADKMLAREGNNLEGLLEGRAGGDGAKEVQITLKTAGLPADGFADLTIDGYRYGGYKLSDGSSTAPYGVIAPLAVVPGKPLAIKVIAPNGAADLRVVFKQPGAAAANELVKYLPSARNESNGVRIGDSGEAIFVTKSEDWAMEFPTQGLFGERNLLVRTGGTERSTATVKFDASEPAVTVEAKPAAADAKQFTPQMFRPGQRIRVIARATDAESGIDSSKGALLYLGDKPAADGKAAANGQVKEGKKIAGQDAYEAEFEIPATTNVAEVKVGAIFTNGVGMPGNGVAEIKVDYTPPVVSILSFDPAKAPLAAYKPGDTVRLIASASDAESDIDLKDDVLFYLGDPPTADGKPQQTTLVLEKAQGVIQDQATLDRVAQKQGVAGKYLYAAELVLPKDIKKETEVKVGVMFVNRVGLAGTRVATVKLDMDFTTATVKVKVTQGGSERLQPGIKVWLLDQSGKVAAEGKTDECGLATFEKVLPGTYMVWGVKEADQNAQDFKTIVARGGDTIDVGLSVKRQPSPPVQPQQARQR